VRAFRRVSIDAAEPRYAAPLRRDAEALRAQVGDAAEVVLLGSIATAKYVDVLGAVFGRALRFPGDFVGRGDMSRGGLLLRAARRAQSSPISRSTARSATACGRRSCYRRAAQRRAQSDSGSSARHSSRPKRSSRSLRACSRSGPPRAARPARVEHAGDTSPAAFAQRPERERAVSQLPQDAQRPAPAEQVERGHDRPARARAAYVAAGSGVGMGVSDVGVGVGLVLLKS
jgi:hypothetical protein